MSGDTPDDATLRQWLIDYLTTTIGCDPKDVDPNSSMVDLGVSSRDSVVLAGELSELLGTTVSPVEFWQHPTINMLVAYLLHGESPDEPIAVPGGRTTDEPIAVVGLGCRLPGGVHGPDSFWDFLIDGGNAVGEVPAQRWEPFEHTSAEAAKTLANTTRWGSYLDDIDTFDADFFEITAREAAKMDPQQRILLEVAWEALENAGIPPTSLRRSQTGVFVGACVSEYGYLASTDLAGVDAWNNLGGALSIIANRLSYFLDLRGPSLTIDTACSSSLVAIHLASQSLRQGDSNVAIAAGVNLLLSPAVFAGFDQSAALSSTGACHSFDAAADGFVRGEGCGAVVLKRLSDARRDGDRLLAVIRGSAVNQDGHSNGLFAPNPAAQMEVLRSAYANADVPVRDVDFIETHGTGTLLGDPIEARALGTVLGRGRPADAPLLLGAVKSNLGHLEAAAGVAGFIKTVMALQKGTIPGNLHFTDPNPHIPFDQLRLKVVDSEQKWPHSDRPRRAGVSSFGFGGTNAHIVVEQAPIAVRTDTEGVELPAVTTLVVSGKSASRVADLAGVLADWMEREQIGADGSLIALPDVAHALSHHRSEHPVFATVCARDAADAIAGLRALAEGTSADGVVAPRDGSGGSGTVFVYSGQGSHWLGMGRRLLDEEPAFAAAVDEIEPLFVEHVGFSLRDALVSDTELRGDDQVQPVLVGLQLALTRLWAAHGVHPDAVIGQSVGEVSAAVTAGALTVADGLRVVAARSRLMSTLGGHGGVALLRQDPATVTDLLGGFPAVTIAGELAPRSTVVAGPAADVERVIADATDRGWFARRVNMEVASHTALMDPILPELATTLADISPRPPRIPFLSTVFEDSRPLDAEYWMANVRRPVRLSQAVTTAAADHATFVEISPHPMLVQAINETLESISDDETAGHHHAFGTLTRDGDDTLAFRTALNATHTDRAPQTPHLPEPHPVLPTTPWQHGRYWMPIAAPMIAATGRSLVNADADPAIPADWWSELAWPAAELTEAAAAVAAVDGASWVVIGDSIGAALTALVGSSGTVAVLPESVLRAPQNPELATALRSATHVLYAPEPTTPAELFDAEPGYRLFHAARHLATAMVTADAAPKLFLLTRNAQPAREGDRVNPAHAVLWGLGRTLALEHPEIWGAVIDVDELVAAPVAAGYVVTEADAGTDNPALGADDQIAYRAGVRHVPRLVPVAAPSAPAEPELDGGGCHLVIGATGNIGPSLIRQLASMGAATVIGVSRNPGDRLDDLIAELAATGTTVIPVAADTADEASMTALFDRFGNDLPRLDGIYLAAFGGGPVELTTMTDDDVAAMFVPKLDALAVLHRQTLRVPVKRFVVFSSISGLTGSRWLGHYAATTTYLDAFSYARRAAGLPATTVNWGLWASLADHQAEIERQVTQDSGLRPMDDATAIRALASASRPDAPVRSVVVSADWPRLAEAYRTRAALRIVDDLLPREASQAAELSDDTEFRVALRACEPAGRRDLLSEHVTTLVAKVMALESPTLLDPTQGFFQFGMDSLMTVTLQRALSESLGEVLPTSVVFDYPTVDALTGYLASTLPEMTEIAEDELDDTYDDLSEDELLRALSERLA